MRHRSLYPGAKPFYQWGRPPLVVGTIHSPGSLHRALRMPKGAVDFFELRVDHFANEPEVLWRAVPRLRAPLIVTVRHHEEGGVRRLSSQRRNDLFARFLPAAGLIDVELRSMKNLQETVITARASGVRVMVSAHYFRLTPSPARLAETICKAITAGADVVKVAALVRRVGELEQLVALFARAHPVPLSVMGMGLLGKVSRLMCACAGSVLNYGYLDQPQLVGQWEATLLKTRIAELLEG